MRLFWKQVMEEWYEISFDNPLDKDQVKEQIIWYNTNIRINKKPIYRKEFSEAGLWRIKDILNKNNEIITFSQAQEKFKIKDFVYFNGIVAPIPQQWKQILQRSEPNELEYVNLVEIMEKYMNTAQILYRKIVTNKLVLRKKMDKWMDILDTELELEEFTADVNRMYNTTISTKLRSFQYRLMLGALVTNVQLKIYKIKDNDLCSFCKSEQETVLHLLFLCREVKIIWYECKRIIKTTSLTKNKLCLTVLNKTPKG